jgi:hypothetical protein
MLQCIWLGRFANSKFLGFFSLFKATKLSHFQIIPYVLAHGFWALHLCLFGFFFHFQSFFRLCNLHAFHMHWCIWIPSFLNFFFWFLLSLI